MNTFSRLMHCDGCTDRLTYQRNIALLAVGKALLELITMALVPGIAVDTIAMAWLNPFVLVQPWMNGSMPFIICLGTFAFFSGLVWNSVHRLRHAGYKHWLGLLTGAPYVGIPCAALLSFAPPKKHTVWDLVG
ncbi:MAG: hypothetical protein KA230_06770 [Flavobacteriales bacterium]|nr:hypothetical protein [Flavobacteriales bacterium]